MSFICPVCEREVEPGEDKACPICDTDLSALVSYQEQKAGVPAPSKKSWWWLLLVLLIPVIWFFFFREKPEPQVALITVVVTATEQPVEQSESEASPTAILQSPTGTPTPTLTPTTSISPTPTTTPLQPPEALAEVDVNCRCGPGLDYAVVGYFTQDDTALIQAVLTNGNWLMITHPQRDDLACWIWSGAVTVSGDLSMVPGLSPAK
jgi:hypothetical protein